ncbi:MAG TPA: NIPSNAP family protein [Chloroflexota bacterium]|nr:NIPSNAP family protein [Chloroflexota bacterium]
MIFEIRTYNLRPGAVAEYESRFGAAYPSREGYSRLYGFWHTEIGPLNQVVHIWPYESLQHRADVRAAAAKDPSGKWPPPPGDLILSQESDILVPISTMAPLEGAQALGTVYELRMYTYPAGEVAKVGRTFAEKYEARNALYPVAGIWTSDLGNLNRLYQLFPYKSWAHREEVRAEARTKGIWPPEAEARPITQLVRHMAPAAFSPLH